MPILSVFALEPSTSLEERDRKLKFHFSDYLRGGFLEADWVVVPLIYSGSVLGRKLLGMKEAGECRQRG